MVSPEAIQSAAYLDKVLQSLNLSQNYE
jgi:hypothetical protein